MPELNEQLATIARDVIKEMREEHWPEDDILWSTCGAILKHCEAEASIALYSDQEQLAAIQALVMQVMKEPLSPAYVVCKAWKTPIMSAHAFSYFCTSCWDTWEFRGEDPESSSLTEGHTPLHDGWLRLVPVQDMAASASCSACHKSFTAASE